jgi:DNA-binding response OmpR family regulator
MIRILYVEDEVFLGKIVSETLEKSGYGVHWEK